MNYPRFEGLLDVGLTEGNDEIQTLPPSSANQPFAIAHWPGAIYTESSRPPALMFLVMCPRFGPYVAPLGLRFHGPDISQG